jgi:hypothetical protein
MLRAKRLRRVVMFPWYLRLVVAGLLLNLCTDIG